MLNPTSFPLAQQAMLWVAAIFNPEAPTCSYLGAALYPIYRSGAEGLKSYISLFFFSLKYECLHNACRTREEGGTVRVTLVC